MVSGVVKRGRGWWSEWGVQEAIAPLSLAPMLKKTPRQFYIKFDLYHSKIEFIVYNKETISTSQNSYSEICFHFSKHVSEHCASFLVSPNKYSISEFQNHSILMIFKMI